MFDTAVDELNLLLFNEFENFLAHRFAEHIGFAQGEAGEVLRDTHDLFLVDGDAIACAEYGFEFGVEILDSFCAVFAGDEVRNPVHGTGAIECDHGDDVFEHRRLELLEIAFHAV